MVHFQLAYLSSALLCTLTSCPKGCRAWFLLLLGFLGCSPSVPGSRDRSSEKFAAPVASLELIRRLIDDGQFQDALGELQRIMVADPENSECVFLLAQCVHAKGDTQQAIELLERIASPKDQWAMPALGQAADWHRELKQWDEAETLLQRAMELSPDQPVLYRRMALLLNQQGRHFESAAYLKQLLRLQSITEEELYGLHSLCEPFVQSDPMLAADQQLAVDGLAKARLLWFQGDLEQARLLTEREYRAKPSDPSISAFLGRIFAELQDQAAVDGWLLTLDKKLVGSVESDSSTSSLSQALQESSVALKDLPDYWYAMGLIEQSRGKRESAIRCFLQSVDLDPTDRFSYLRLSQLLSQVGRSENARIAQQRFDDLARVDYVLTGLSRTDDEMYEVCQLLERLHREDEAFAWQRIIGSTQTAQRSNGTDSIKSLRKSGNDVEARRMQLCDLSIDDWPLPLQAQSRQLDEAAVTQPSLAGMNVQWREVAMGVGLTYRYRPSHSHSVEQLNFHETNGGGIGILDFDNDGWPDVFFTQGDCDYPDAAQSPNGELYRNLEGKAFEAIGVNALVADRRYGQGVTIADLNQDGFDDVLVANIGLNSIYINQTDGTFGRSDIAPEITSGSQWTTSIACGDLDGDQLPEVVEVNYVDDPLAFQATCQGDAPVLACNPQRYRQASNRMLSFKKDATWELMTDLQGQRGNYGYAVVIGNFDRQQGNELFITNDTDANQYWTHRLDDRSFTEAAVLRGCAFGLLGNAESCMGVAAADFNRDGLLDIHVTNFTDEPSDLYLQTLAGYFENRFSAYQLGQATRPEMGWGTVAEDFNNDGWVDLAVLNGGLYFYHSGKERYEMRPQFFAGAPNRFTKLSAEDLGDNYWDRPALGRSVVKWDWNRDGKVDLLASHLDQPVALLENVSRQSNWLQLELIGTVSERDAIGAVATITCGTDKWTGFVLGGDGYLSKSEARLHFGISSYSMIDSLEIQWPSGEGSTWNQLRANHSYLCIEGESKAFSQ